MVEYAPNIEGFVPDYEANKGIFKSAERPENDSQPVVITFYYKPIPKTSYTIQYQDEKGKTIFESERKEARVGEYVSVEEAQEITGYKLAKKYFFRTFKKCGCKARWFDDYYDLL